MYGVYTKWGHCRVSVYNTSPECIDNAQRCTYHSFSFATLAGATACKIWESCLNTFFNMPNSNSCIKSTTMIGNSSKPRGDKHSVNAFFDM